MKKRHSEEGLHWHRLKGRVKSKSVNENNSERLILEYLRASKHGTAHHKAPIMHGYISHRSRLRGKDSVRGKKERERERERQTNREWFGSEPASCFFPWLKTMLRDFQHDWPKEVSGSAPTCLSNSSQWQQHDLNPYHGHPYHPFNSTLSHGKAKDTKKNGFTFSPILLVDFSNNKQQTASNTVN